MSNDIVIEGKDISIGYPKTKGSNKKILYNDLSFELYKGELVCLLGPNGAGKSTLLRTISMSQPLLSGEIYINEKKLSNYSEKELSRLMGLVLTDKTSAGGLTVYELVELGRYPYTGFFGQTDNKDKEIINKAINDVGIAHKKKSYISELSDGERQKAMIAKTLAQECPIIILDEPTAFLDIKSSIEIIDLLHQLAMNQNKTILLSTHNVDLALHLADRLWLLSEKDGLKYGVPEDIVLSGGLNNLFDSNNIVFNNESGNFVSKPNGNRKAYIEAKDNLCDLWAKNLLARHNIQIASKEEDADFKIIIHSPTSITLKFENTEIQLDSYGKLAKYLRKKI